MCCSRCRWRTYSTTLLRPESRGSKQHRRRPLVRRTRARCRLERSWDSGTPTKATCLSSTMEGPDCFRLFFFLRLRRQEGLFESLEGGDGSSFGGERSARAPSPHAVGWRRFQSASRKNAGNQVCAIRVRITTAHGDDVRGKGRPGTALTPNQRSIPARWDPRWLAWLFGAALVVITCLAFGSIVHNDFVNWDDDKNFLQNRALQVSGSDGVKWAWTTFQVGVYQPLAWLAFLVEHRLWGLNAWGYHLASLVLYCAALLSCYRFFQIFLRRADNSSNKGP